MHLLLSMAAFILQWQTYIVRVEAVLTEKVKIFTIWFFMEKVSTVKMELFFWKQIMKYLVCQDRDLIL